MDGISVFLHWILKQFDLWDSDGNALFKHELKSRSRLCMRQTGNSQSNCYCIFVIEYNTLDYAFLSKCLTFFFTTLNYALWFFGVDFITYLTLRNLRRYGVRPYVKKKTIKKMIHPELRLPLSKRNSGFSKNMKIKQANFKVHDSITSFSWLSVLTQQ